MDNRNREEEEGRLNLGDHTWNRRLRPAYGKATKRVRETTKSIKVKIQGTKEPKGELFCAGKREVLDMIKF